MTTRAKAIRHVENGGVIVAEWHFAPGAETGHHITHEFRFVEVELKSPVFQPTPEGDFR
jgi:hypothetical protein